MMKSEAYLSGIKGTPIGITFLVLFFAILLTPEVNASYCEKQPKGSVITISGYVTCRGERISDVAVEAETTNDVSISDREGKFSVKVKKGGILIFQKNGYTPYEYIADEPEENLIVCLLLENNSINAKKQPEKVTKEEIECIINITTKKKE